VQNQPERNFVHTSRYVLQYSSSWRAEKMSKIYLGGKKADASAATASASRISTSGEVRSTVAVFLNMLSRSLEVVDQLQDLVP